MKRIILVIGLVAGCQTAPKLDESKFKQASLCLHGDQPLYMNKEAGLCWFLHNEHPVFIDCHKADAIGHCGPTKQKAEKEAGDKPKKKEAEQ